MWFHSWSEVSRVLAVGAAAYVTLVAVLRLSGKRTVATLNAFDMVVTVAVGSAMATVILSPSVSFVDGAAAFVVLAVLQFIAAKLSTRSAPAEALLTSYPTVLLKGGRLLDDALRRERVSEEAVLQAIRASGQGDVSAIEAVVLEMDGSRSIISTDISTDKAGDGSALPEVRQHRG